MAAKLIYHTQAERPSAKLWVFDDDGTLIDFSTGSYSFVFRVGLPGFPALLTKSSNITGAAGAGVEPSGTPNVVINWTAGELDIAPGAYTWQLTATTSSLDRVFSGSFVILDDIS